MSTRKNLVLTSIGAALEYYDFAIYALLAPYISRAFFPQSDQYTALIETFVIFATGYISRPIGGIIFGMLGDKTGRKKTFVVSILMMAISTLLMGIIPTYNTLGITASVLLLILRIMQGMSFGAEMPGAVTFLSEHSQKQSRALNSGILVSSVGIGVALGSIITYALNLMMTKENLYEWGWRIPFLIGGMLAIIAFLIRKHTQETPHFLKLSPIKNSMLELCRNYKTKIVLGIGIMLFPSCFVVFFLSIPAYLKNVFGYSYTNIYLVITIGYLWSSLLLPFFGYLSDRISRKRVLLVLLACFMVVGLPFFNILKIYSAMSLVCFVLLYQTIVAAGASSYFALLVESFPTSVRFTGVALCYNLSYVLASLIPIATNYVYKITHNHNHIALIFISAAFLTWICVWLSKDKTNAELS